MPAQGDSHLRGETPSRNCILALQHCGEDPSAVDFITLARCKDFTPCPERSCQAANSIGAGLHAFA
eukprot:5154056-Amphidinium_carterae.2